MSRLSRTALLVAALASAPGLDAQGVRGWVGSTMRYVELQTVTSDSVYRTGPVVGSLSATQDLRLTVWGLGVRGLSSTIYLRSRLRDEGDDFVWPRSDDEFDALLAYAQLDRGRFRIRLGRQETQSGLGFRGFDGGRVAFHFGRRGRIEAYGGRSLARGLREPTLDALGPLETFFPDGDAWLLGFAAGGTAPGGTSWELRYQRELLPDRSGLVSERASVDFSTALLAPVRLTGAVDYDFAFGHVGKSHLTFQYAPPSGSTLFELTGRRYQPYFQLSTIWGFFDPVGYHGAEVKASWSPVARLGLYGYGGFREYEDAHSTVILSPLEDDAWRAGAGAVYRPSERLTLDGGYRLEWGNGAYLSSGDLRARWQEERWQVNASLASFQQIEEFRLGDGRVLGGGVGAGVKVLGRSWIDGSASLYLHRPQGNGFRSDWDQFRGWVSVRVELGSDPGLSR